MISANTKNTRRGANQNRLVANSRRNGSRRVANAA
tara:strand:- start:31026 stop:31130 length:105 start_codon:yes stop_codon:yes gene_type:complete